MTLSKRYCRRLDIALYFIRESFLSRTRRGLCWHIDNPRIIPRSAEIMQCVEAGSVDGVQRLLSASKATPRDTTIHGATLLYAASKTGNRKLMDLIIPEGGDVNTPDEDGETPLHWAMTRKGNHDTARVLIENGADLANNTLDRRTPLHTFFNDTVGMVLSRQDWIEDMFPDSQGMSTTHFMAWSSKTTPALFEKGVSHDLVDLWSTDSSGRTCLHLAASRGNFDLLKYLLRLATPTETQRRDHRGRTALHYAIQSKRLESIDLLLANWGNLHIKDNPSRTVLHCAAQWGNLDTAMKIMALNTSEILLSPDKNGKMPSHFASGPNAAALRECLASKESAAEISKDSTKDSPGQQSLDTKNKSDSQINVLSKTPTWDRLMLPRVLLSTFQDLKFVPDPLRTAHLTEYVAATVLAFILSILVHVLCNAELLRKGTTENHVDR